jgi:hypothetical protein
MTIGTVVVACFAASMNLSGPGTITSTFRRVNSAAAPARESVGRSPHRGSLEEDVLTADVAKLAKAFFEGREVRRGNGQDADSMNL